MGDPQLVSRTVDGCLMIYLGWKSKLLICTEVYEVAEQHDTFTLSAAAPRWVQYPPAATGALCANLMIFCKEDHYSERSRLWLWRIMSMIRAESERRILHLCQCSRLKYRLLLCNCTRSKCTKGSSTHTPNKLIICVEECVTKQQ